MTGDPVAAACDALAGYMNTLEGLVAEPSAPGATPAARSRAASVPEPYGQAGRALMTSHEGIRRLEAWIRLAVSGHPGQRRGGSLETTAAIFEALPKLAAGLRADDDVDKAVWYLDGLINENRSVPGIDENRRWRHLPRRAGELLPPRCPYCRTYNLLADVEARVVACSMPKCQDRNGQPPVASMGTSADGRPQIAWADGLTELAPDME